VAHRARRKAWRGGPSSNDAALPVTASTLFGQLLEFDLTVASFANPLACTGDGRGKPNEEFTKGLRPHVIHAQDDIGDTLEHRVINISAATDGVDIRRAGFDLRTDAKLSGVSSRRRAGHR
jgi:hypothetical protein